MRIFEFCEKRQTLNWTDLNHIKSVDEKLEIFEFIFTNNNVIEINKLIEKHKKVRNNVI